MWEAIIANRRRSRMLIALMGLTLAALGFSIGATVEPLYGGATGVAVALALWFILWLLAWAEGDKIVLALVGAREIQKHDAPQLWNVIEEMTLASGLPRVPRVYLIEDDAPNATALPAETLLSVLICAIDIGVMRQLAWLPQAGPERLTGLVRSVVALVSVGFEEISPAVRQDNGAVVRTDPRRT